MSNRLNSDSKKEKLRFRNVKINKKWKLSSFVIQNKMEKLINRIWKIKIIVINRISTILNASKDRIKNTHKVSSQLLKMFLRIVNKFQ